MYRCHNAALGATEFDHSTVPRRFRPVSDGSGVVGTLYAADTRSGALSETVFHNVPARSGSHAPTMIQRSTLTAMLLTTLVPNRDLSLAKLYGSALDALQTTRDALILSPSAHYPATAAWAQVIYQQPEGFDGLIWVARQDATAKAVVLWGNRVQRRRDVDTSTQSPPLPLYFGDGLELVYERANQIGAYVFIPGATSGRRN